MALSRGSENHAIFSAQPGEPKFHQIPIESVYGRSFGPAVCAGVLHHLLGPDRGLRALRKVLRPSGANAKSSRTNKFRGATARSPASADFAARTSDMSDPTL